MSGSSFHLLAAEMRALRRDLPKNLAETRSILLPVLLCIILTQITWITVYDCTVTKNIFPFGSEDSMSWFDGIANAASAMAVIALVSGVMITLAIYHFKKIVEAWLALSCIVASLLITGTLFHDGAARLPIDKTSQLAIASVLTTVYGGGAVLAFFTKHMPAWFHHLYVVTNCSSIAVFYLTCMPGHTAWFLLAAVVGWDIFAVLAPIGPLKLALERAQDYSADTLRFMMFTADPEEKKKVEEPTAASEVPAAAAEDEVEEEEIEEVGLECEEESNEEGEEEELIEEYEDEDYNDEMYDEEEEDELDEMDYSFIHRPEKRLSAGADNREDHSILRDLLSAGADTYEDKIEDQGSEIGTDQVMRFLQAMLDKAEEGQRARGEQEGSGSNSNSCDTCSDYLEEGEEQAEPVPTASNNNDKIEDQGAKINYSSGEEKTAKDALDAGTHLGFGDFIFYSILVGKSMTVGFLPAIVSTIGVITGLACTLTMGQETLPALPISIVLGMIGHFSTVAQMAVIEYLYNAYAV